MAYEPFEMTSDEYLTSRDEDGGYCLACRESADECKPDARHYKCESCGRSMVFTTEELLSAGLIKIAD